MFLRSLCSGLVVSVALRTIYLCVMSIAAVLVGEVRPVRVPREDLEAADPNSQVHTCTMQLPANR